MNTTLGNTIASLRKNKNITAEQMAEAMRVSRQTISKWENGETAPNAYQMVDIANYLDTSIGDIYLQYQIKKAKEDNENEEREGGFDINRFLDAMEPKNIEKAIDLYDNNRHKLKVRVGVNIISYRDLLLLASDIRCFRGYSEFENPVRYQELKTRDRLMPDFAQCLRNNGLAVFYNGDNEYFYNYNDDEWDGTAMMVILYNERELLNFKNCTRQFFTGLRNVYSGRRSCWGEPKSGEARFSLNFVNQADLVSNGKEMPNPIMLQKWYDNLSEESKKERSDEWEDFMACIDNISCTIQYIKDEEELSEICRKLNMLDEKMHKEFLDACSFNGTGFIFIVDLQENRILPFDIAQHNLSVNTDEELGVEDEKDR